MTEKNQDFAGAARIRGKRFREQPDALMERLNCSIDFDRKLYKQDIAVSRAHAGMLTQCQILTPQEGEAIDKGLTKILAEIEQGVFPFRRELEDIHMNIEARLEEHIGAPAKKLHTARSRNDQVVTDLRLWLIHASEEICTAIAALQHALLGQARCHLTTIMPGFTHLQPAQPVTFAHHCLAYLEMLERDFERFAACQKRMNICPLGAGALAGSSFAIDRFATAQALGFSAPMRNSLDSVSSRDFVLEFLAHSAICATNLSRLAEEIILWTSPGFGFIELPDRFSTGSSIMPQKRNPDAAELIRAKTGRICGAFNTMTIVIKALPLAYAKDLQEDKEAVFDTAETIAVCLAAMEGMITGLVVHKEKMQKAACYGYPTATDLADWLVRECHLPFREAHHITGQLVAICEQKQVDLPDLALSEMQKIAPQINEDAYRVLGVRESVESRDIFGGTAPAQNKKQIARWRRILARRNKVCAKL